MTELAIHTSGNGLATVTPSSAVASIVQWAGDLVTAGQAMDLIVDTPFVPDSFWPMPPGVSSRDWPTPKLRHPRESIEEWQGRRRIAVASGASAVVYGDAIGYAPPAALQSIFVVKGRPGLYAEAMKALVISKGHDIRQEDLSDSRCVMIGRRKGGDAWERATFTMDRAKKAGYLRNSKYAEDPQSMLLARATSIICRIIAPDVLKGLAAVEELIDEPDGDTPAPATRTVRRTQGALAAPASHAPAQQPSTPASAPVATQPVARQRAATSGPPLPGEDEPQQEPTGPQPMSEATWRKINARFVELEVVGDGQTATRLKVIAHVIGRQIHRGNELTAAEGQLVLDNLAGDAAFEVLGQALDPLTQDTEPTEAAPAATVAQDDGDELLGDGDDPNAQWDGAEAEAEGRA